MRMLTNYKCTVSVYAALQPHAYVYTYIRIRQMLIIRMATVHVIYAVLFVLCCAVL